MTEQDEASKTRTRVGRFLLLDTANDTLTETGRLDVPAVLDAKWLASSGHPGLFGAAFASGDVRLFAVKEKTRIEEKARIVVDDEALCLSLDWTTDNGLVVSDSKGQVALYDRETLGLRAKWAAHGFEAWMATSHGHVVWSGGDDALLKVWDVRAEPVAAVATIKTHGAGVCSITKDPAEEHRWFTGCYDDCLRVWDQRNMKSPLARRKTAGGVWRIRPHYSDKNVLALACMYGGAEVVRLSKDNAEEVELLQRYTGHSSITYGIDWHPLQPDTLATCSFYDHSLQLWKRSL